MGWRLTRRRVRWGLLAAAVVFFSSAGLAKANGSVTAANLTLDEDTAKRGYPAESGDGLFRLYLPPQRLNAGTAVTITANNAEAYPVPAEWRAATPVYTLEAIGEGSGASRAPLVAEFQFTDADVYQKHVAAFHRETNLWQTLPTAVDWSSRRARAAIPWTFGRLALFEDRRILEYGRASWYRNRGCLCAASPDYPRGTRLKVTDVAAKTSVVVRVNDYGPDRQIYPDRVIDLDRAAFSRLRHTRHGLLTVLVQPLNP